MKLVWLKKEANVRLQKRWNEILGKMILEGEKKLTEEFVLRMFKAIHQESMVIKIKLTTLVSNCIE
jgi:hypothetical protein